jgi:redox-sensitive bicupin YhaK (pirin superfamily)
MVAPGTVHEPLPARDVILGRGTPARRLLPNKARRMIGPWCLAHHFGPDDVRSTGGLRLPPHPYAGLQTVTWLFEGLVAHSDSLGNEQEVRPGELSLLTAGPGVSRAEVSPAHAPETLHGVQLWVALPGSARDAAGPAFTHLPDPPTYAERGATLRVLAGSLAGETSPAPTYSPLVAAEVTLEPGATATVPLERDFEHGVLVVRGELLVDGETVGRDEMVYLGRDRDSLGLAAPDDAPGPTKLLLLGGEPLAEELVLWWNFLGRNHDEVLRHREDWTRGGESAAPSRFGEVPGFEGARMLAPPMPNVRLRPWLPVP